MIEAVLASCAIPGVLNYISPEGELYFDGGLLMNLPASAIRDKCDYLIGADLFPFHKRSTYPRIPSRGSILRRGADILQYHHAQKQHELCDLSIRPLRLLKYKPHHLSKKYELYALGKQSMLNHIDEVQVNA